MARLNRKSQLHIMETVITMLVFSLLLSVAVAFYAGAQRSAYASELGEAADARAIALSKVAASLPELQCSSRNIVRTDNCVDKLKLEAAAKVMKDNSEAYYDLFGYSSITVEQVYPKPAAGQQTAEQQSWTLYEKKPQQASGELHMQIPIVIYNPVEKTYAFGVMDAAAYS